MDAERQDAALAARLGGMSLARRIVRPLCVRTDVLLDEFVRLEAEVAEAETEAVTNALRAAEKMMQVSGLCCLIQEARREPDW